MGKDLRDDMNQVILECKDCGSIIKSREDRIPKRCSCGKNRLSVIGTQLSYQRKKRSEEILKDPELFRKITEDEFDKKIVGEVEARKVIFLCAAGGRLVQNCQIASYNILVNDEAGAGKDYVTSRVLQLLPKEFYVHKTRISPAVFTYWNNTNDNPDWTWDGKVFYPEDISESVLNSDVFKVMASSGSTATIVIKQKAVDIEINGKPVMITTTATATPNPELTRRFVILNLDSSEEQTKAIMKRHLEYASKGEIPEYNPDYTYAMRMLKRVKVKILFAEFLEEVLPSKSIIMRTHLPRFIDYIKASAAFHQYQRENKGGFILAQGEDYDIARECFLKLTSNKYMIPLTVNQKRILAVFEKNPHLKGHVKELNSNHITGMAYNTLKDNLDKLVSYNLLTTFLEEDSRGVQVTKYCLDGAYKPNEQINLPTFEELYRITETTKITDLTKSTEFTEITSQKQRDILAVSDVSVDFPKEDSGKEENLHDGGV